jgi:pimeloyl-ACP methyl ester carboxylesterase
MAGELAAFLDSVSVERAILVGHSMGGKLAMQFALDYSDRTEQIVVVDIAPRAYRDGHSHLIAALRSLDLSAYSAREEVDQALADKIPADAERRFLLKNLSIRNGSRFSWQADLEAIDAAYPRLVAAVDGSMPYMGPALFIRGQESDYVHDGDWLDIVRLFPAAELETIPRAGHWVHADAPDPVGEAIRTFLDY